jgi:hypothetical protein
MEPVVQQLLWGFEFPALSDRGSGTIVDEDDALQCLLRAVTLRLSGVSFLILLNLD